MRFRRQSGVWWHVVTRNSREGGICGYDLTQSVFVVFNFGDLRLTQKLFKMRLGSLSLSVFRRNRLTSEICYVKFGLFAWSLLQNIFQNHYTTISILTPTPILLRPCSSHKVSPLTFVYTYFPLALARTASLSSGNSLFLSFCHFQKHCMNGIM